MDGPFEENDEISQFLAAAKKMVREAQLVAEAVPNVEIPAVEKATRQLYGIRRVLLVLDDPFLDPAEIDMMVKDVTDLMLFLENSIETLASGPIPSPSTVPNGSRGRPTFQLDIDKCERLHDLGNTWPDIANAMGVTRQTIFNHFQRNGRSTARPNGSQITDDDLDEIVSQISVEHPFSGQRIIHGHLKVHGIHVQIWRVQESLRRVDDIGVLIRWRGVIKRRVYRVRGANALWHQDGNEKLRPWGFYVHGSIDGHARLITYLICCSNKRSSTVEAAFMAAVEEYGWPSRVCGDFGKENNGIEKQMIQHWGENHRAYLRGRSTQNIRIERVWRDVRRDCLEVFRQTFTQLEEEGRLDVKNPIHRASLYLVYQPRIQASLDRTRAAWNNHKIRTAKNKSPIALYELSRVKAINGGYWTTNPGDTHSDASVPNYGFDAEAPSPPDTELRDDPTSNDGLEDESHRGASLQTDAELDIAAELLGDLDLQEEDENWGMRIYQKAVDKLASRLQDS